MLSSIVACLYLTDVLHLYVSCYMCAERLVVLNSYYDLLGGTTSVLHLPSTDNGTSCIIHQATFYYKRVREFVIHILSTCNTSTSCIIHQTDEIDSIFIANRFGTTYHK